MVGMPYPNPTDPELRERMRFLDACALRHAGAAKSGAPGAGHASSCAGGASAGRQYMEDLCMKAVNQCIGRVIRHRRDWAAIVLADARWVAGPSSGSGAPGMPPGVVMSIS